MTKGQKILIEKEAKALVLKIEAAGLRSKVHSIYDKAQSFALELVRESEHPHLDEERRDWYCHELAIAAIICWIKASKFYFFSTAEDGWDFAVVNSAFSQA